MSRELSDQPQPQLPPPQDWADTDGRILPGIFSALEDALRTGRIRSIKQLIDKDKEPPTCRSAN